MISKYFDLNTIELKHRFIVVSKFILERLELKAVKEKQDNIVLSTELHYATYKLYQQNERTVMKHTLKNLFLPRYIEKDKTRQNLRRFFEVFTYFWLLRELLGLGVAQFEIKQNVYYFNNREGRDSFRNKKSQIKFIRFYEYPSLLKEIDKWTKTLDEIEVYDYIGVLKNINKHHYHCCNILLKINPLYYGSTFHCYTLFTERINHLSFKYLMIHMVNSTDGFYHKERGNRDRINWKSAVSFVNVMLSLAVSIDIINAPISLRKISKILYENYGLSYKNSLAIYEMISKNKFLLCLIGEYFNTVSRPIPTVIGTILRAYFSDH